MSERTTLAVIFGGRSTEHEVSVTSARSIMAQADTDRFDVVPFGITRGGAWLTPEESSRRLDRVEAGETRAIGDDEGAGVFAYPDVLARLGAVDVAFPIVHGRNGEDGTLQGLLELAGVAYVGSGVAASGVGMDKELMRAVFAREGLPQARYAVLRDADAANAPDDALRDIEAEIGYPCFVKPANGGSSVGISRAVSREDLGAAVLNAARHDRKVLVEEAIEGREVECAVLGNADPQPSPPGEIIPHAEFFTYEAKYLDDATEYAIPARVSDAVRTRLQQYALRAFRAVDCAGLARVDFFVTPDDDLRLIELNTLPGFTPASMYPRLWQEAGLSYSELITRLVELAIERHEEARSRA